MVDRGCAQIESELDRTQLCELVAVDTQPEAGFPAGQEVSLCLLHVERLRLDEDVRRLGDAGRVGQDVRYEEVEVVLPALELRRNGMRAEERRDSPCLRDGPERRELGLAVEAVA